MDIARKYAAKPKPYRQAPKLDKVSMLLERTSFGRKFMFNQARKQTLGKTKGNYPAPELIIDLLEGIKYF